ncbi:MAG: 2-oxo acid dehydrogenase subunit E2 [Polyangiaceae bacterium]|nr:2-oxo acid dehydrogenase subunit E2 [Polyangiaceae bacterium]
MATWEFKLPDIGEGVTEGEIVKWLVQPGDLVNEDQPMVEVMTDKATVTITSPRTGKILEARGGVGSVVPVHAVLVVFDLDAGKAAVAAPAAKDKSDGPAATAVGDIKEDLPGMSLMSAAPATAVAAPAAEAVTAGRGQRASNYFNEKPLATPATRKLARDLGVDLRRVEPTGPHGRVTKDDVRASTEAPPASVAVRPPPRSVEGLEPPPARLPKEELALPPSRTDAPVAASAPTAPRAAISIAKEAEQERVPLRGVRKRIFDGMMRSKHTAAHFTFVEECDVTALKDLRTRMRGAAEKQGVKLTYLPFIVKACVAALKKMPALNSSFDEATQEIVLHKRYHIGIASSTDSGLIVPVVRDADRKSLIDIGRNIARLADDTKAGKVKPEDLGGSTFTITSLGAQGGLFATPILNFPEVAILGVHQMKQKPVVRDGQIVIGDVMLLSLSFDHRLIDGHIGAQFAYEIIGYLENPDRLFLEMA